MPGISDGSVFFNATTDPEHGKRARKKIDPLHNYPIDGASGSQVQKNFSHDDFSCTDAYIGVGITGE